MSEWRKIWANGLPDEGRSPKSGHRMSVEGMPFPWRWYGGTIFTNLGVIWGMSADSSALRGRIDDCKPNPRLRLPKTTCNRGASIDDNARRLVVRPFSALILRQTPLRARFSQPVRRIRWGEFFCPSLEVVRLPKRFLPNSAPGLATIRCFLTGTI